MSIRVCLRGEGRTELQCKDISSGIGRAKAMRQGRNRLERLLQCLQREEIGIFVAPSRTIACDGSVPKGGSVKVVVSSEEQAL